MCSSDLSWRRSQFSDLVSTLLFYLESGILGTHALYCVRSVDRRFGSDYSPSAFITRLLICSTVSTPGTSARRARSR